MRVDPRACIPTVLLLGFPLTRTRSHIRCESPVLIEELGLFGFWPYVRAGAPPHRVGIRLHVGLNVYQASRGMIGDQCRIFQRNSLYRCSRVW